jgi:type VI secretion system protein ImpF
MIASSPHIDGKVTAGGDTPMADVNHKTHVSPPLMHAFRAAHDAKDAARKIDLRTSDGDRVIAGRRLRPRQVITERVLRREVARDLDALLNTVAMESTVEMTDAPYARKSVLNFGLPDISPLTIDTTELKRIPEEIRTAVVNFEPRLASASLHIERDLTVDATELRIRFLVRADLTCYPVQIPVEFIADIVESGKIVVNRL